LQIAQSQRKRAAAIDSSKPADAVQTLLKKDGSVANRQELNMVLQAIKAISINPCKQMRQIKNYVDTLVST
jgi:hypothetical protein